MSNLKKLEDGAYLLDSGEVIEINKNAVILHDNEDHCIQSSQICGLDEDDFYALLRKSVR